MSPDPLAEFLQAEGRRSPGDWHCNSLGNGTGSGVFDASGRTYQQGGQIATAQVSYRRDGKGLENAAFIAAASRIASPLRALLAEVEVLREFVGLLEPFDGFAMNAGENPSVTERANTLLCLARAARQPSGNAG